jgi:hypothetical protein
MGTPRPPRRPSTARSRSNGTGRPCTRLRKVRGVRDHTPGTAAVDLLRQMPGDSGRGRRAQAERACDDEVRTLLVEALRRLTTSEKSGRVRQ